MPWPKALTFWLVDVRKAALVAGVATVLGSLIPGWNAALSMYAIESMRQWSIPLIVLGYCFDAILPVFYFALYRNEGLQDFPRSLRLLSLAAAIVLGIIMAAWLPQWIESFGAYWAEIRLLDWSAGAATVSMVAREPGTSRQLAALLSTFSNLAYIGLLVTFFRQERGESSEDIPVSKLLAVATKVAGIAWGLVVAGSLVRLPFMPFVYIQIRDLAISSGRRPPQLEAMMLDAIRTLLVSTCFFTAPYAVYRSRLRRTEAAEPPIPTP
jgi:hypothetical protein